MFSGIVEAVGLVEEVTKEGTNVRLRMTCPFVGELSADQSVAHNGVCLTVERVEGSHYEVVCMEETLRRSNLGALVPGAEVNLERSMRLDDRLDGHIVQGHVDATARCLSVDDRQGSREYRFQYSVTDEQRREGYLTVPKGSVCVNGVSLTVCDPTLDAFTVCIIPYTYQHTNFHALHPGAYVNLEFDILGKYVARYQGLGIRD